MTTVNELVQRAESDERYSSINEAAVFFSDVQRAHDAFAAYLRDLRRIEIWNQVSNLSEFDLFTEQGRVATDDTINEGHFIRLSVKGSGKFDWVRVVKIDESASEFVLTVKPTFDPTEKADGERNISHFFSDEAENNFCLVRDDLKIRCLIIGLNEHENSSQTGGIVETVRNWITANFGSYLGMQRTQWSTFARNFLETREKSVSLSS